MDDLDARLRATELREVSRDGYCREEPVPINPDGPEAADRLILYREALEAITREDGKNSRGFIDWQRCVDRIQAVARAVLSSDRKVAGDSGSA